MSRIIKITETLYLVEVPKDAKEIKDTCANGVFFKIPDGSYDSIYFDEIFSNNEEYKIHLAITTPELSFDFEVDDSWVERLCGVGRDFRDYKIQSNSKNKWNLTNKEESFRTRIQKAIKDDGFYLVNPYQMPCIPNNINDEFEEIPIMVKTLFSQWQQAESNTIKGNLILLDKIN